MVNKKIIFIIIATIVILLLIIILINLSNSYDTIELKVETSQQNNKITIISKEQNKEFDYNVYLYGINSIQIKHNKKIIDLKDALTFNNLNINDIVKKADEDEEKGIAKKVVYLDGGTTEYIYTDYKIIKLNRMIVNGDKFSTEKDIYITRKDFNINQITT